MGPQSFIEWLQLEIGFYIEEATRNEPSLEHAQKICFQVHEAIKGMSVTEQRMTKTLLWDSYSLKNTYTIAANVIQSILDIQVNGLSFNTINIRGKCLTNFDERQ